MIAGGLMLGEVLALYQAEERAVIFGMTVLVLAGLLSRKERWKSRAAVTAALLLCIGAGAVRMEQEKEWVREREALKLEGKLLWLEGIAGEAEEKEGDRGKSVSILLKDSRICRQEEETISLGSVQVFLEEKDLSGRSTDSLIGCRLKVKGRAKVYEEARNPGEFDYRMYCLGRRSVCCLYGEEEGGGEVLVGKRERPLSFILSRFKRHSSQVLEQLMDGRDGGIMKAMLLGDRSQMDEELYSLYQKNGIAHILAISGLHISLLGAGFYRMMRKAGVRTGTAAAAGSGCLILYGMMTGFSPSSLRAVAMMVILFGGEYLGRSYDMVSAACLALILLMLRAPFLLLQSGFQLSFGAVCSIGLLGKWLCRILKAENGLRQQAVMGAAVQIGTCPLILFHFYQYPIYGFFLNLAVIPLMAYTVVSGILGILLGSFFPPLGRAALGTCHYVLAFYEELCRLTEKLPMANLILGRPDPWQLLLYGFLLAAGLMLLKKGEKARYLPVLCLALLLVLHPSVRFWERNRLEITFLDVGQGDGILIQTEGKAVLIDGGSSDNKNLGEEVLIPCLKSKGISALDFVIVSHGDEDHISGIRYLIEEGKEISIGTLVLPALGREEEAQKKLKESMKGHRGKEIREMKAGDQIRIGHTRLFCLYPGKEDEADNRNQQSLVLILSRGDLDILFPGDTEEGCERKMTERKEARERLTQVEVLKAAHHGSSTSTGDELLSVMEKSLKWSVISCGEKNRYGHPSEEVMKRLKERGIIIWETRKEGAVILKADKKKIKWEQYITDSFQKE